MKRQRTSEFSVLNACRYIGMAACLLPAILSQAQAVNLGGDLSRPIPGAGHDYIHMLNETVDPASGNLSLKFDLPVPKGRGLTIPFAITYNSGQVFGFSSTIAGVGSMNGGGLPEYTVVNGWGNTFPQVSMTYASVPYTPNTNQFCSTTFSYVFYDPSGASHMLGLAAISPSPAGTTECQDITYNDTDCTNTQFESWYECWGGPQYQTIASGGDDQVFAQSAYCSGAPNEPEACGDGNPPFTVTDSSGTVYQFLGGAGFPYPTQIEDRNGNMVQVSNQSSGLPLSMADALGRQAVVISGAPNSNIPTNYQVGGLSYSVNWGRTTASLSAGTSNQEIYVLPQSYYNGLVTCNAIFTASFSGSQALQEVQSLTLPNGQQYTIQYDPTWGLPSQITYPDGGWVQYTWKLSDDPNTPATFDAAQTHSSSELPVYGGCNWLYAAPVVATRTVGYTSGVTAQTQTFTYTTCWNVAVSPQPANCTPNSGGDPRMWQWKSTVVTTTNYLPNNTSESSTTTYTYKYVLQPVQPNSQGQIQAQLPVENTISVTDWTGNALQTVTKAWGDQFEMTSETTLLNNGESEMTGFDYYLGFPQRIYEKDEFDFGQSSSSRTTMYAYGFDTEPCREVTVSGVSSSSLPLPPLNCTGGLPNGTPTRLSETDVTYDGGSLAPVPNLPSGTHDETNYGPGSTTPRGNPTRVVKCLSGTGPSCLGPTTTYTFDETGQELSRTSPCGNGTCVDMPGVTNQTTTYSYTDSFASGGPPSGNTNAYLTKITDPLGFTEQFQYNYTTGELANATDENGQTTTYVYSDPLYRLTQTINPDHGGSTISYYDPPPGSSNPATVTTTTVATPDPTMTSVSIMDGVGHVIQTQSSDPNGADVVSTTYDGSGRAHTKTNPFLSSSQPSSTVVTPPSGTPLMTYYYDALGRPIETVEQDNSVLQWCYNGVQSTLAVYCSPSHLGSVTTGTWVDATDENGNHWQRTSDAFGRLREVMEPNGTSQSASMETDYGYDALNNLLSVTQWGGASGSSGGRSRSFTYDNLSRLLSAANPETGTVGYAYDFNGNVLSKTDARGIVTSYIYNGINQVLSKSYSDGATPLSCYQYGTSANSVERLINEWTQSASATALCQTSAPFLAKRGNITYDRMGRVLSEQQYTLATQASATQTPYSPVYSYDLAGNLISSTTGVGPTPTAAAITFTNTIDSAGRLQTVNSNLTSNWVTGSALPATLFSSTPGTNTSCTGLTYQYWPFGGLMNATLGNGLTLNRAFDSRLRTACETDTGSVVANSIPGAAAVTITGAEQSH